MKNIQKSFIIKIVGLIVSVFLSIFILSIFIFFYKYYLVHQINLDKVTDVKGYPYQFSSNMTEGYSWFNYDKNGFNNYYPIKKDRIDVLLMGSSHMEALQMMSYENVGYLLNDLIPEYYTYNIGMAAHSLYKVINNLSYAYNYFKPVKCIIIETSSISFDKHMLNMVYNQEYKDKIGLKYRIKRKLPSLIGALTVTTLENIFLLFQNSSSIINLNISAEDGIVFSNSLSDYTEILNNFLAFARKSVPNNFPLIIFYHPSYTLQSDGSIKNNTDKWYLEIFAKACKNNNIIFIDTDEDLVELYKTRHILPYGFINTRVGSGHLNKYGHEVIAKRLAKEINKLGIRSEE